MSKFLEDRILSKIETLEGAAHRAERLRADGKTIVTSNGCFDVLHWGHIRSLTDARSLGDVLFVGLNNDESVRRLKGPQRPILPEEIRLKQLAGILAVDVVCLFPEDTPTRFLEAIRPHVHAKGADYRGKPIPEIEVMKKWGGKVEFLELEPDLSTTALFLKFP